MTYEHIGVTPIEPAEGASFAKGRSGSILTVDDVPVGIAIELPPAGWGAAMRVLRLDAIKGRLDRYLSGSTAGRGAPTLAADDAEEIPYEVVSWTARPLAPENDPTALTRPGGMPFLAEPARAVSCCACGSGVRTAGPSCCAALSFSPRSGTAV